MRRARIVWILTTVVFAILGLMASQQSLLAEVKVSPANLSSPDAFLPIVRHDFNWRAFAEWTPQKTFEGKRVTELALGPEPGWIWAVADEGLYRSKNDGVLWEPVEGIGLPDTPERIAARVNEAGDAPLYALVWGEIYASLDGGETWSLDHTSNSYLSYLGYVENTPFAATSSQVFRRSLSGGWEPVGDELGKRVSDLAVFQDDLYAATADGLYRLVGNNWEVVTISEFSSAPAASAISSAIERWVPSESVPEHVGDTLPVHDILVSEGRIFIGTGTARGIYRSDDGTNWRAVDVGLSGAYGHNVRRLIASNSGRLFAGGLDGVFVSENDGERWQALDLGLPHSETAYALLLDGVNATSLAIVRDEKGEQTLGAVFNREGVWYQTVIAETIMHDLPPQQPAKAVLIVGPLDPPEHEKTLSYIASADRLAAIMAQNGMEVVKVYWPESTWEKVRAALSGASIVVYKGHGFGLDDVPADTTEMYGSLNGFCLVTPADPASCRLGTQDMLVATNRLAEDAIAFFQCSYCGGTAGWDPAPVSEALARRRIEAYSSTVLRMGGGGYFASVYEEPLLESFFANPDKTLGELYRELGGAPEHAYQHVLWPTEVVWFDADSQGRWFRAFVGDPSLTARDILGP